MIAAGRHAARRVNGAALKGAIRPSRRVVILSTPHVTAGAAPPTVTFSGSLDVSRDVRFECTTGGPRGSTVWRYSLNGGASYATGVPGAATIALSPSGIIANLSNSTYGGDEVYRGVVDTLTGPYGTIFTGASGSESVRSHVGYINGRPTVRSDGSARYLFSNTSALADAIVMGNDLPFTIAGVARNNGSNTPTNQAAYLSFCNGSAGAPGFFSFTVAPSGAYRCGKRGDTATATNAEGGTVDNNPFYYVITHTGTSVSLRVNGAAVFTSQAQNVTSIAGGSGSLRLGILSVAGTGPNDFPGDVDIGDTFLWNAVLSANEITLVEQALKRDWGL